MDRIEQEETNDVSYGSEQGNITDVSHCSRKTASSSLISTSNEPINMTQEVEELLLDLKDFSLGPKTTHTETLEKLSDSGLDEELDEQQPSLTTALIHASSACEVCKLRMDEINALLQAAQKERHDAREWADKIRTKTYQWVQLQKQNSRHSYSQDQMERLVSIVQNQHLRIADLESALEKQASEIQTLQQQQLQQPSPLDRNRRKQTSKTPFNTPARPNDLPQSPPPTVSPSHSETGRRRITNKENQGNSNYRDVATPHIQSDSPPKPKRRVFRTKDCQIIEYSNGAVREIYADTQVIKFPNGDIQTIEDDTVSYYFKASNILQIQYEDHVQYHFENGQIEEHYEDRKVVHFCDGTTREYSNASFAVTV